MFGRFCYILRKKAPQIGCIFIKYDNGFLLILPSFFVILIVHKIELYINIERHLENREKKYDFERDNHYE